MVNFDLTSNAMSLSRELDWFEKVLEARIQLHFGKECPYASILEIEAPKLSEDGTVYERFVFHYGISIPERLVLTLTQAPHLRPQALDLLLMRNTTLDRPFTEFGIKQGTGGAMIPTIQTALFLLAGKDMALRLAYLSLFSEEHYFSRHGILDFGNLEPGCPDSRRTLSMSVDSLDMLTTGIYRSPPFGMDFPAKRLETPHEWADLILEPAVMDQVLEILAWIDYGDRVLGDLALGKKLKPGFCSMFYGPPGTGKTMTGALLGKNSGRDVYRIDLSMVVSKYIGETEKNLEKVFSQAQHRNWILFFDEADALFGKRTEISDSHDRYANQEISYLLQRMEDFSGMVILATNKKDNLDEAFLRRIQSFIHFPFPRPRERLQIWTNAFTDETKFKKGVDLGRIAGKYEISGGSIMNVVRYAGLMMLKNNKKKVSKDDIIEGIRREARKEGRVV